jgi:serine/threonine protein kinase
MHQLIDQVLNDRYHIQSMLGQQMGRRTYLAKDQQTEQNVVVKLVLFGPDFSWDDLKLFNRESAVLQSLDHPCIPKYLDHFEMESELGRGFALIQTHIEAKSLQAWVESGRTFEAEEITAIAKSLLEILSYLHDRQPAVIHRDIKPSNILLAQPRRDGREPIYLVDFGAVQTTIQSGTRTIVGTYGYMPPEQFGDRALPASDLYALGATLIYLATGQHPDQLPQRKMQICFDDHVNLPPHLIYWLKELTAPGLDRRMPSAKQALDSLERENHLNHSVKPLDTNIKLTQTPEQLKIVTQRFSSKSPQIVLGIIFLCIWIPAFTLPFLPVSLSLLSQGEYVGGLFLLFFSVFGIFSISLNVFSMLVRTRLQITRSNLTRQYEIFGLRCSRRQTIRREDVIKLEMTRLSYRTGEKGKQIEVPPRINIWAGTQKIAIGGSGWSDAELNWIAQVLAERLNLPIHRH